MNDEINLKLDKIYMYTLFNSEKRQKAKLKAKRFKVIVISTIYTVHSGKNTAMRKKASCICN